MSFFKIVIILIFFNISIFATQIWRPYNVYPVGGSALSSGGAYVASAREPDSIYWNPAGMIYQNRIGAIYTFDIQLEVPINKIIDPNLWLSNFIFYIPSLVNIFFPIKRITLAMALFTPFQRKILLSRTTDVRYYMYQITGSFSIVINKRLSIGCNLGWNIAHYKDYLKDKYTAFGFSYQAGLIFWAAQRISLGISYNSQVRMRWIGGPNEATPNIIRTGIAIYLGSEAVAARRRVSLNFDIEYQGWRFVRYDGEYFITQNAAYWYEAPFFTIHPHIGFRWVDYGWKMFPEKFRNRMYKRLTKKANRTSNSFRKDFLLNIRDRISTWGGTGIHFRVGFMTNSFIEYSKENGIVNNPQYLLTFGGGAISAKLKERISFEASIVDSLLFSLIFMGVSDTNRFIGSNNNIESFQITIKLYFN